MNPIDSSDRTAHNQFGQHCCEAHKSSLMVHSESYPHKKIIPDSSTRACLASKPEHAKSFARKDPFALANCGHNPLTIRIDVLLPVQLIMPGHNIENVME